jgi:hypothetical protein
MINHRLASAQPPPATKEPRPSIVVAIRITLNLPAAGPVEVKVEESAPLDDAMWRPEGVDAGHRHDSTEETGKGVDRRPNTPVRPLDVAVVRAPNGRPHRVDAEVELTSNDGADAGDRRFHASAAPPADPPIPTRKPRTNGTGRWQDTGAKGRGPSRRIRRHTLIVTALAIAAILAVLATVPPTSRPASTAAPKASVSAAAAASFDVTQDDCTGSTSTRQSGGTTRCTGSQGDTLPNPTSAITASPCLHLLATAALTIGADPTTWMASLIEGGGRPGQTIDQAVRTQLIAARTPRWRANHSDPEAIALRVEFDSIIADRHCTVGNPNASAGIHHRCRRRHQRGG